MGKYSKVLDARLQHQVVPGGWARIFFILEGERYAKGQNLWQCSGGNNLELELGDVAQSITQFKVHKEMHYKMQT
jgi:hypothetical protein